MCGIAGIISFNKERISTALLKQMTDAIAHRGPDGEGQWVNGEGNVGLAHRRLSIIDLSEMGCQPMHYMDRYSIVFNGEIYNYIELKDQLLQKGYKFISHSDTEVLMALYDHKKQDCLHLLDGMFSFVIYDKLENKVFCARDRFGEKPFFYSYQPGVNLMFGSEMKAIHAVKGKGELNNKMLYNYLAFNYVDNRTDFTETFYSEISILPHSNYMTIDLTRETIERKQYWSIDHSASNTTLDTGKQVQEKVTELFYRGLQRRLRSDVSVGSSLSGGLDSSIIVCAIDELFKKGFTAGSGATITEDKQKTFSARFPGFARDEGKYMQMVIDKTNVTPFYTYPDEQTLLAEIDKVAYHQEEPFGSASILAQYEVMKLAKENNVTVLLDGQGADEIFAGYHGYYSAFFRELEKRSSKEYQFEHNAYMQLHVNNAVNVKHTKSIGHYARKYVPSYIDKLRYGKALLKQRMEKYFNNDFFNEYGKQYFKFGNSFNNLNDELNYASMKGDLQVLLRYADRNSMAHSREVRLPFLYHELVEYAFTLPSSYKIHEGWTKWILRTGFDDLLPQEIGWRKDKIGYEPPQKKWMENKTIKEKIVDATEKLVKERVLDKKVLNKKPGEVGTSERGNNEWSHLMTSYL